MNCELCQTQTFKYSCPRCNVKYCSLDCYKSENHSQCSEAFYKECVINELHNQEGNSDDRKKVLEMLQRLEEEPEDDWEDLDSDDDSNDHVDLADRLAEVDLNNADAVWERLTDEEKQEFKSIVYNGEIEKIVQTTEPWWKSHLEAKLVRDVEEDKAKVKEILKRCPKVSSEIKEFRKISTRKPAACIIYNIANVIAAYTYIVRYYNGDHRSYEMEASDNLISICDNLKSNANFETITTVIDSIMLNCHNANLYSDVRSKEVMLEDLMEIVNGPGDDSHKHSFMLSALSDIVHLFKTTKQKYRQEVPKDQSTSAGNKRKFTSEFPSGDGRTEFKQLQNQTHFVGCLKKLEFYLAFVKSGYNDNDWPINWES